MEIKIKRAYESPAKSDGVRVLVDRIWPRGVKKDSAGIDHWLKDLAPSTELRKWFNHDPERWAAFKKRYFAELREHKDQLHELLDDAGDHATLTLVFAARDEQHNNAVALREYLNRMNRS